MHVWTQACSLVTCTWLPCSAPCGLEPLWRGLRTANAVVVTALGCEATGFAVRSLALAFARLRWRRGSATPDLSGCTFVSQLFRFARRHSASGGELPALCLSRARWSAPRPSDERLCSQAAPAACPCQSQPVSALCARSILAVLCFVRLVAVAIDATWHDLSWPS